MKQCSRCQQNSVRNLNGECKICVQKRAKEWDINHPERAAYRAQKSRSKRREIEFNLTFNQWVDWWGNEFEHRGTASQDLCMARIGDTGPYELGNIMKITNCENYYSRL